MVEENISKIENVLGIPEEDLRNMGVYGECLIRKSEIYEDITKLEQDLIDAKNSEKSELGDLWNNTIWDDVLNGKITVDNKKAYVNEHIRDWKADCETIENKINDKWRAIDIINNFLRIGGIND